MMKMHVVILEELMHLHKNVLPYLGASLSLLTELMGSVGEVILWKLQ